MLFRLETIIAVGQGIVTINLHHYISFIYTFFDRKLGLQFVRKQRRLTIHNLKLIFILIFKVLIIIFILQRHLFYFLFFVNNYINCHISLGKIADL